MDDNIRWGGRRSRGDTEGRSASLLQINEQTMVEDRRRRHHEHILCR